MSLLYYIMLRAEGNYPKGQVLFWAIQLIWFILLPLFILEIPTMNITIVKEYKMEMVILAQIIILGYDYYFYFREVNKNKFLIKYTNKYKVIENHPNFIFLTTYLFFIFLGLFICLMIPRKF